METSHYIIPTTHSYSNILLHFATFGLDINVYFQNWGVWSTLSVFISGNSVRQKGLSKNICNESTSFVHQPAPGQ